MVLVTFDFRRPNWLKLGQQIVVATRAEAEAGAQACAGPDATIEHLEVRELSTGEYARWLERDRRLREWQELAQAARAYRGLL